MRGVRGFVALGGLGFGLGAAACSGASGDVGDAVEADAAEIRETNLDVTSTAKMPIAEVSGLGKRTLGGKTQYLAVGDARTTLVTFDVDTSGKASKITSHSLDALFGRGASQWEAVAGDSSGAVFIMNEASDKITVLDSGLGRITHTIQLSVPEGHALSKAWKRDPNSHAEGMVLLSNGHILAVKEKDPVALIEFAPEGEDAAGYDTTFALGNAAFKLPRGGSSKMVAAKHWVLKSSDVNQVSDVSELALDVDGRLLLLTDQGRAIVRVERGLRVDEDKMDLKSFHKLPSSVDKPEGLVMAGSTPMVAIDAREAGDTLFSIERLP